MPTQAHEAYVECDGFDAVSVSEFGGRRKRIEYSGQSCIEHPVQNENIDFHDCIDIRIAAAATAALNRMAISMPRMAFLNMDR
jgi:hypothetical protein